MENHSNFNTPLLPISAKPPENPNPSPSLKPSFAGNYLFILLGPFMSLCIYLFVDINGQSSSRNMLAILSWVFDWWLTEAVPMPIASMAPLFLFPMFGVASADAVARSYMNDVISLMLGSFILALAVEHYNIYRRLALNVTLIFCGDPLNPPSLLLGVCSTTAFISMWMQNTAAAAMMMPVAKGILQGLPPKSEMSIEVNKFCKAVILGVTYSAAIGGMSTLTGTGVNLILVGMWGSSFPEEMPIGFSTWFLFGFPLALLLFLALWGLLCLLYLSKNSSAALSSYLDKSNLKRELVLLGPMDFAEKIILFVFSVMMATLLFMLPNKKQQGEKLMDWNKCKKLPWNIILLLGAGFAIADGVLTSGLAGALSAALSFLWTSPQLAVTPLVCMVSCTITEFTSNSATATLVIPLLIQLAKTMSIHPLLLMVPGAIGAQFAFLLPTGTPSNVVGFSTGHIGIMDMIMVGLPRKMIGVGALSLLLPTVGENLVNSPCKLLQNLKDL